MTADEWPAAEEWRAIEGYDGWYEVSDHGRIRSWKTVGLPGIRASSPTLRKLQLNTNGRLAISLRRRSEKALRPHVHRLVAAAFIGDIPGDLVVCHNDGNPFNNHVSNLRFDTASGNEADKVAHGTSVRGVRNPGAKLDPERVREIRQLRSEGVLQSAIAERHGISRANVSLICSRSTWQHVA